MKGGKKLSISLTILASLLLIVFLPAGARSVYAKSPTILLMSDCSAPGTYTGTHPDDVPERDNTLVWFLEYLGYTVDTSGMNKAYREGQNPFNDPAKLAALDAADLVLVSRHSDSLYYDSDRQNWNELEKPLLLMNGYFTRGGVDNRWGWTTGGSGNSSLTQTDIVIEAGQMGHPFVAGFTTPIIAFDWSSAPTPGEAPKTVFLPNSPPVAGAAVIGTFDNMPILMDIPAGTDFGAGNTGGPYGVAGGRRAFLGTWGYDIYLGSPYNRDATFLDFLTSSYLNLFEQTLKVMAPRELIIYVDDDAAGLDDGTSWENAYNYLQDALKSAWLGDEIRVAQGIYKPDQGAGITPGDRGATFRLKTGVAIYGSYAGIGAQDPDERDPNLYETILSGDIGVVDVNTDNSYFIVFGVSVTETAILDGFTITAGNSTGTGGGMLNYSSSGPTVNNCTFTGNAAGYGGGMHNHGSSPTVTNCTFSENSVVNFGGGMSNGYDSSPTVTNCVFNGNTADVRGGGMYNFQSSPTVTNCTFSGNSAADDGGGMCNVQNCSPTVTNCTFSGNSAADLSGGMYNFQSSPTVTSCTFTANTAGTNGGGMYNFQSNPTVTNCILWGDEPNEICDSDDSSTTLTYCDVQGGWPDVNNTNISADPCFVDANNPDPNLVNLRLLPDSPCIDKGSNNAPNLPPTDLAGNQRIFDGDGNGSFIVDMGAYEFGSLNLLAHWKLDESFGSIASDSSGDNHGTLQPPTPPLWGPAGGWFNGALQLDGVDDYVDCGNDASLNITNEITLSVWVNTNDSGNGEHNPYVSKGDHSYAIKHHSSNNIEFFIYDSDWHVVWYPVDSTFNGAWHHLAGTYDGFELKLYVDGVLEANSPHEGLIAGSTFNVNIGRNAELTDRFYEGLIDDVAIFDRALTPAEITQLRNNGGSSFIGDTSLEALWELDESSGGIAYDSSGKANHGTLEPPPPPVWQPAGGRFNGALLLDGVDDYVDCGNDERLNITDAITLSVWVKTNDAGNGQFNPYVTKGDHSYAIKHHNGNNIEFFIYDSGWHTVWSAVDSSFNGVWHHLAGTYDGGLLVLYVDGTPVHSFIHTGTIAGSTFNVNIGRNAEITDRLYDGLIDDVAIFSRALNFTEINNLKNNGGASFIGDPNLEALWELDESSGTTAYDSSGNGLNGSLEPTSPLWQPAGGRLDGALEFDGSNDYVSIPNESRFDITYQVTVSAWIKVKKFDKDWQAIVTKGDSAWRLHRLRDTNSIAFHCNLYPDEWGADGSVNVNNGQWHHVAGVYDGTRAYLYVDGELDSSEAAFGLIGTNNYPVMIGENAEQTGRFWNGLIDDVRIYACALGPSEVYQLYSNICYVDADATGNNNGLSWTNAFNYLQDALAQATSTCEIRVAEGTYKPDATSGNPSGTGDRFATFQLIDLVTLKGGYAGAGTPDPNDRDVDAYQTVLSGDIGTVGNDTDNSYHVVTGSGNDATSILDGFTITGGHANGSSPHDSGAGMFNSAGSPAVTDCNFSENTAGTDGGGMYNQSGSSPTVTNCTFSGNTAGNDGGGMYNTSSSPTLTNCTFSNNTTPHNGGGMYNTNSSNPIMTNCSFTRNTSPGYGGGICNVLSSSPALTNCNFTENEAGGGGGMINSVNCSPTIINCVYMGNSANYGAGIYNNDNSNPIVTNCTFTNNTAITYGGAMRNYKNSSPTVNNCTFSGNVALGNTTDTGGGGMYNSNNSNPTLTNCTLSGNTAVWEGGGMRNSNSSPTITNCTFSNNTTPRDGGGMFNRGSSPTVTNCIISNNSASYGGGMYNYSNSSPTLTNCTFSINSAINRGGGMINYLSCSPAVTDCNFSENTAGTDGGGMYNQSGSSPTVTNCTFSENSASYGGGMYNYSNSHTKITNCTFSDNSANNAGGGIINNSSSSPTMTNCVLWHNLPDQIKDWEPTSVTTITYSDVQGGWPDANNTNIDADPRFVDANNPDPNLVNLRLRPGSPCIDKGSNAAVPSGITSDLDGHPRIIDGDCDDIDVVDMGAYEFAFAYVGDFDNNCSVNFFDVSIFGRAWMTKAGDPDWNWACDISYPPDDYIDWRDVAVLCDNWLATP